MDSSTSAHAVGLKEICAHLDGYLRIDEVPDYPTAHNGLQVQNSGTVYRLAVAVDAAQATIDSAAAEGADLLLVHHGLFWDPEPRVTGRRYSRLRRLLEADIAVYSAHLPLDVHPEVGNNSVLARAIGLDIAGTFGEYRGHPIGVWGRLEMGREALAARLEELLGDPVRMIAAGPERVSRVGVVTGGAAGEVKKAREAGIDTFITGEAAHHNYFDAEEEGVNLILGGHYATETWGVRALAAHLEEQFGLAWTFIDHPTGL